MHCQTRVFIMMASAHKWLVSSASGVLRKTGVPYLAPKWVKLATNVTNPASARRSKMYWDIFWKISGFIPFGTHLTHFRPKSGNSMPAWLLSLTSVSTLHYNKMTGLRNDCVSVLSSATTHCTPRWQSSIASYRARQERCAWLGYCTLSLPLA